MCKDCGCILGNCHHDTGRCKDCKTLDSLTDVFYIAHHSNEDELVKNWKDLKSKIDLIDELIRKSPIYRAADAGQSE